jgi:hypothetical protein
MESVKNATNPFRLKDFGLILRQDIALNVKDEE